jgi:hypothetical protein
VIGGLINKLGRLWQKTIKALFKVLFRNFFGRTEEYYEELQSIPPVFAPRSRLGGTPEYEA